VKRLFLLLLLAAAHFAPAQNKLLDSLWKSYRAAGVPDTQRLKTLDAISFNYAFLNPDSGRILAQQVVARASQLGLSRLEVSGYNSLGVNYMYMDSSERAIAMFNACYNGAQKINDKAKMAASLQNIGLVYDSKGDYARALSYKLNSLKLRELVGDKKALGNSYANLGISYTDLGDYPKGIEYYLKSQRVAEDMGDKNLLANNYNNIGLVYQAMDDAGRALDYYLKSISLKEELGNKRSLCSSLANAATIYYRLGKYEKAWELYQRGYKIQQEINNRRGIANSLSNLGVYYQDLPASELARLNLSKADKYRKALDYHEQALKMNEALGDKHGVAVDLLNIGNAYCEIGKLKEAEKVTLRALRLSEETEELNKQEGALGILATVMERQGRIQEAYAFYKRHIKIRDSIFNRERNDDVTRKQIQYEYDKKATADSVRNAEEKKVKDAEITAQQAALRQEKTQRFALYGGLLLLLAFAIFAYNRFKVTQKQKHIIEDQKQIVEEKQKEILDSIHYAKNIQRSLLPTDRYIARSMARLYPKNHLSGKTDQLPNDSRHL
jgi:tetratricopeptide (TPR) repeat protein